MAFEKRCEGVRASLGSGQKLIFLPFMKRRYSKKAMKVLFVCHVFRVTLTFMPTHLMVAEDGAGFADDPAECGATVAFLAACPLDHHSPFAGG